MLKLTFWILLVANIVMFAATQTYTDSPKKQDEPQQLQPVEPEKIRLLPSAQINSQSGPEQPVTRAEQASEATACLEIGEFDATSAGLFGKKIKNFLPASSVEQFQTQNPSSYMVYLPSAKNKKTAEIRISELQKKNISNYFLITNGTQFKNAISLGIFKNEEAAKNLVAELQKLGFDDAQIHVRSKLSESSSFRIRNPDTTQLQQLELILAELPQVSKKDCPLQNNFAKDN